MKNSCFLFFFGGPAVRVGVGVSDCLISFLECLGGARDFLDFLLRLVFPTSSTGSSTFRRTLPLQPSARVFKTVVVFLLKKIVR